jgi:uncharacterized protein YciI
MPMLFVVNAFDRPDALALRLETRPAHVDYLNDRIEQIRAAGATLNADDEPVGSVLIIEAADRAAAEAFAANDPFNQAGVFERVEIRAWRPARGSWIE